MPKVKDEPTFIPIPQQYIAGMHFEFGWSESDVQEFIEIYIALRQVGSGEVFTILTLSEHFKRKDAEVAILIMDLAESGYICKTGKGSNPRPFKIPENNNKQTPYSSSSDASKAIRNLGGRTKWT